MDGNIAENQAQQAALYGRPLGALVRELTETLGLTQARLAEVLGLSAPMLSQLASGRRVKIGNPLAVARLQAALELAPLAATLPPAALQERLESIRASATTITTTPPGPQRLVAELRALGSPEALSAAAAAAAPSAPALAEVLRRAAEHHG